MPIKNLNDDKPWNNKGVRAYYETTKLGNMIKGALSNGDQYEAPDVDEELLLKEQSEKLSELRYYDPEAEAIIGNDVTLRINRISSENEAAEAEQYLKTIGRACLSEADRRGDSRVKQYYEDLAFLIDRNNGNYTQMMLTSPYMNTLMGQRMTLTIPAVLSSADQKAGLGQPLYEAIYDFNHAVVQEAATEYKRQQFEAKGWEPGAETQYLNELHESHTRMINQFQRLSQFKDDPQNNTAHYTQDTLAPTFGRGTPRRANHAIGIIRGEKKAIENGWGKDDLFVLGLIGGIEEEIKYQSTLHNDEVQATLPAFKSEFLKLKNECLFTTVTSAADKLAIADKVKAFIDNQNSAAARACCSTMNNVKRKFDEIHSHLTASIRDNQPAAVNVPASNNRKYHNTGEYLAEIFDLGKNNNNYDYYIREYLDTGVQIANSAEANKAKRDYNDLSERMLDFPNSVLAKLGKSAFTHYFDLTIACAQEEEQMAEDIRAGRVKIDEKYDGIKKDYAFSKQYAKNLLVNSKLNQQRRASQNLCKQLKLKLGNNANLDAIKEEYLNNCVESVSPLEASTLLKDAYTGFNEYVYNDVFNIDTVGIVDKEDHPDITDIQYVNNLRNEKNALNTYETTFNAAKNQASTYLNSLTTLGNYKVTAVYDKENHNYHDARDAAVVVDPKKANSQTFMNMCNALEDVNRLDSTKTPQQTLEAYRALRDTSKAYSDKIDAHTFSGIRENGRNRRKLSGELYTFAQSKIDELTAASNGISRDASIDKQKTQIASVERDTREYMKPLIQETLNEEKNNCLGRRFEFKEGIKDPKDNKRALVTGMAELVVIHTLKTDINSENGKLIASGEINHAYVKSQANRLATTNDQFKKMVKSIKNDEDVKRLMDQMKENPDSVIDELNKHQIEPKKAPQNKNENVIVNVGPKL